MLVRPSLEGALELLAEPEWAESVENVFVIGGGQVYEECMRSPLLSAIHLTQARIYKCGWFGGWDDGGSWVRAKFLVCKGWMALKKGWVRWQI